MTEKRISEAYPSLERFEEILEEARLNAKSAPSKQLVYTIRQIYDQYGADTVLNDSERLALRQIATGVAT